MLIEDFRMAGNIKRWHTKRTQRQQTVAEHTFGVICIVNKIAPECRKDVLLAALYHDLAELDTGDIPAPVKIHNDDMLAAVRRIEQRFNEIHGFDIWLTKEEEILVKWADMMELILWCLEEIDLGNRNLMGSVKTGFSQLDFLGTPNEAAAIMRQEAEIRFERARR